MSEYESENVFEENVRRLIESSAQATDADQDAAFEQKVVDSVLAEVEQTRAATRAGRIRLIARLTAAAAVIVVGIGAIVYWIGGDTTDTVAVSVSTRSSSEMMTAMSLKLAYRRGGLKEVENQCKRALEMLGPLPPNVTVQELLEEVDGI
jgi:hypothetical protein